MEAQRQRATRRRTWCRRVVCCTFAVGLTLPALGCHVEYDSIGINSSKYKYDNIQYFPPGPGFPDANTRAATKRARLQAMGIEPGPIAAESTAAPTPKGALPDASASQRAVPNQ